MSKPKKTPRRRVPKLVAHNTAYIDPMCCGSRVGYRVVYSKWNALTMSIILADCDKQARWEFMEDSTTDPLLKIDNAIAMLQEARDAWLAGIAHFKKENRGRVTKWQRPSNADIRSMAARVLTNARA